MQSVQTKCGILNCVRTWRLSSYCPLLSCSALLIPCFTACLKEGRSTAMSLQLVLVLFARVLESELWATCGSCATFYLAIHQILGDAPFVHLRDMSKPAKPKFTEHCIDSCCPSLAQNIIFGDLVLPCVSHDLAETSKMESIQTVCRTVLRTHAWYTLSLACSVRFLFVQTLLLSMLSFDITVAALPMLPLISPSRDWLFDIREPRYLKLSMHNCKCGVEDLDFWSTSSILCSCVLCHA